MPALFSPYRINFLEAAALLACAILVFYEYTPLLWAAFPLEQESAVFLRAVSSVGWWDALGTSNYLPIYPFLNGLLRLAALMMKHAGQPAFFAFLLMGHLLNGWLLMVITRNQFLGWKSERERAWPFGGRAVCAGICAAMLFCSFNAYYLMISSPLCSLISMPVFFLGSNFFIQFSVYQNSSGRQRARFFFLALIAFSLPFLWAYSLFFLGIMACLWAATGIFVRKKDLGWLVLLHLGGLSLQMGLLDPRLSAGAEQGMLGVVLENPSLYFFSVVQNLWSGILFGVFFQNFLQFTSPYSIGYCVGAVGLFFFLAAGLSPKNGSLRKGYAAAVWMMIGCVLNICLLRNGLSNEVGRLFDGLFLASQPRYYYLPSAFLAMAFVIGIFSAVEFFPARGKRGLAAVMAFVFIFSLANARATRGKVEFAAQHMQIEIWEYIPYRLLRPPEANPRDPSFLKGYEGVIR